MEFRPLSGGPWQQIDSTKIGSDIYESTGINSFGDYALVKLDKASQQAAVKKAQKQQSDAGAFVAAGIAGLLVIMAGIIFLIRRDQKEKGHQKAL
jgi:3-oxoacyl-(acyl-carrier-protein) synthase